MKAIACLISLLIRFRFHQMIEMKKEEGAHYNMIGIYRTKLSQFSSGRVWSYPSLLDDMIVSVCTEMRYVTTTRLLSSTRYLTT